MIRTLAIVAAILSGASLSAARKRAIGSSIGSALS